MSSARCRLKRAATLIAAVATLASLIAIPSTASATPVPSCSSAGVGLASLGGPNFYIDNGSTPQFTSSYTGYTVTNSTGSALSDTWVSLGSFTGSDLALATGQPAAERISSLSNGSSGSLFWYLNAPSASVTAQGFTVTVYRHRPGSASASVLCTASGGFNQVIGTLSASANKVTNITVSNAAPSLGSTFDVTVTGATGTMGTGPSDNSDPYALWMSPAVAAAWPPGAFRLEATNLNISADGTAAPADYANTLRVANLGSTARGYTATYTFRAIGFTSAATTVQPVQEISSGTQVKHTGSYSTALPTIASPSNTVHLDLSAAPTKLDLGGGQAAYTATVHGPNGVSLDSFVLTPPAGASVVSGSATFDGAPISDPVSQSGKLVFTGPFQLTGANIPLTFSLNLAATPGDQVTSLLAGLGSALIGNDPSDITGAHPATATVNVDTAPSAPDFAVDVPRNQSSDVDVSSHPSDADGDTLTVTGVSAAAHGTATLTDGAVSYQPDAQNTSPDTFTYTVSDGRGGSAQGTITVNVAARTPQTISFPGLPDVTLGDGGQASATSDSGLPVTYSSLTTDVCTVDSDTGAVTTLAAGTCTIAADQAGDGSYAAAEQATSSFTVNTIAQTITFPDLSGLTVGGTQSAAATSDSGLPVTYSSLTTDVCTVDPDSGLVSAVSAGTCTIAADQAGNDSYAAAEQATGSFTVDLNAQTINAADQDAVNVTAEQVTLSASADSGLPVTFTSDTPDVCTVDSSTGVVTLLTAGTCTVTVSQDGDDSHSAAEPVDVTFTVDPAAQSVTFDPPTQLLTGADAYALTATSSAFLPVSFTVTSGNDVCSISGADLTVTGTGTCDVEASAAGDDVYAAATPVTHTIHVVAPSDDSVDLPATTGQSAPHQIDVLTNDPDGLTLTDVTSAAHGTVSIDGDQVTYTPDVTFRGADQFGYTVTDGSGRTASALVTVQVADAAPTASNATVGQVAGTVASVPIDATDLNGDPLTLTVAANPASVPVTIDGLTVRLAPPATQTGKVTITVAVHDGAGQSAQATIVDTVRPQPVAWARRTISKSGTHITWAKATATGAKYVVRIGSDVACVTTALSCDTPRLLGPAVHVWVRVVGANRTVSTRTVAKPMHGAGVLVDVVYFSSASWTLSARQQAHLAKLGQRLKRDGFTHVQLNGYTDFVRSESHSLHLSQQRTETIARLLAHYGFSSAQSWLGMKNPAVSGHNSGKNRRVEILVS